MPLSDAAVDALGGAIGACTSIAVTYPLTSISTWQTLDHKDVKQGANTYEAALEKVYSSIPPPVRDLLVYSKSKGLKALYAGIQPCIGATALSSAAYFYLYTAIRQGLVHWRQRRLAALPAATAAVVAIPGGMVQLAATGKQAALLPASSTRAEDIGVLGSIVVASLAGAVNVVLTTPMWIVATQMQALQRSPNPAQRAKGSWQVAVETYKEEGPKGFWKGLLPGLVMVTNPTIQYILYEWLTARVRRARKLQRRKDMAAGGTLPGAPLPAAVLLSAWDAFFLSAVAKLGATLATYPLLLIKNRLQATNKETSEEARYKGVVDAATRILTLEGWRGFYKGMKAKLMQTILGAALLMAIKEHVYNTIRAIDARAAAAMLVVVAK